MKTILPFGLCAACFLVFLSGTLSAQDYTVVGGSASVSTTDIRGGINFTSGITILNQGGGSNNSTSLQLLYQLIPNSGPQTPIPLGWRSFETTQVTTSGFRQITGPGGNGTTVQIETIHNASPTIAPGNYRIIVTIDPNQSRTDTDRSNNTAVIASSVNILATPNITFTDNTLAIQVGGSAVVRGAGESFSVTTFFRNVGDQTNIPAFDIDYYLVPASRFNPASTVTFQTVDGVYLGRRGTAGLGVLQQINPGFAIDTEDFNLPANLSELVYRIGIVLDPQDSVIEKPLPASTGTNQRASVTGEDITIRYVLERPDYDSIGPTSIAADSTPAGELVNFNGVVRNNSSFGATEVTTIRHFLTRTPGGNQVSLGTTLMPGLAANATFPFSVNIRVPANLFPTDYYYSFRIDDAEIIPEKNEANNTGLNLQDLLEVNPPALPDLVATGTGQFTPAARLAGQTLNVQAGIANQGFSGSGAFNLRFVLSTDGIIGDADDITIGTTRVAAGLGSGGTATISPALTLPSAANLPPGSYRFGWIVDSSSEVTELSEANNTAVLGTGSLLTISPPAPSLADLRPTRVSANPQTAASGDGVSFTTDFINSGTGNAPAARYEVFLTLDQIIGNDDDIVLGGTNAPAIAAGANGSHVHILRIPGVETPVGTYTIAIRADANATVAESNETNNLVVFTGATVTIRPADADDLPRVFLNSATATPLVAIPGGTISHNATVTNKGGTNAGGIELGLVISNDQIIGDADDIPLDFYGPFAVEIGETASFGGDATIPTSLAPGNYFLGWALDSVENGPGIDPAGAVLLKPLAIRAPELRVQIVEIGSTEDVIEVLESDRTGEYFVEYGDTLVSWNQTTPKQGDPASGIRFVIPKNASITKVRFFRAVQE